MESRALGRTDNRDCLGARYDILKSVITLDVGRWTRSGSRQTRWWRRR